MAEERQSVADFVRRALDAYLAQRLAHDAVWRERLQQFFERGHARIPADTPPDEIEADITAAREEVRGARRAPRRR